MRPELLDESSGQRSRRVRLRPARGAREGLLIGPSSGRRWRRRAVCRQVPDGSRILAITYDTGERYLSVDLLFG